VRELFARPFYAGSRLSREKLLSAQVERRRISQGGRVSVPSTLRHRWSTQFVGFVDKGDHAEIWPLPDNPIAAARGALKGRIGSTNDLPAAARGDESTVADPHP
jgi:hypothetical protein